MTAINLSIFQGISDFVGRDQKLTITDGSLAKRETQTTHLGRVVSWVKQHTVDHTRKTVDQGTFRTALQNEYGKRSGSQAYQYACKACGYTDGKSHSLTAKQISAGVYFAEQRKQEAEEQNKNIIQHFIKNPDLLKSVGIARVPGQRASIQQLIAARHSVDFESFSEHDLTSVFKQNLRDNLTNTESAKMLAFMRDFDLPLSLLPGPGNLPPVNELPEMVQDAIKFSTMVLEHQSKNKMDARNIGIVMAPNIAEGNNADPIRALALKTNFFNALINRAD
ncbi:hypothetical protein [Pseudovibrio sp. Ad37]|uniref:hypothetical protein n=1 Tax=Pseudovibrio sp. Ad37 TaxID=989422 RepID=UPI0007AED9DD|nr:hypothetical protein [Pseudovibrio sp. Ad37]KZL27702.1 RhoGAP domain protein [Pseudovibrio sp. Ad37]